MICDDSPHIGNVQTAHPPSPPGPSGAADFSSMWTRRGGGGARGAGRRGGAERTLAKIYLGGNDSWQRQSQHEIIARKKKPETDIVQPSRRVCLRVCVWLCVCVGVYPMYTNVQIGRNSLTLTTSLETT